MKFLIAVGRIKTCTFDIKKTIHWFPVGKNKSIRFGAWEEVLWLQMEQEMATDDWIDVLLIRKDVLKQKKSFLGDFERLLQVNSHYKTGRNKSTHFGVLKGV